MIRLIYAVYDNISASIIGGLIMETTDAPAIRAFHDALHPKNNSILSQHPEDYVLKELGNIDDQGNIVGNMATRTVATGSAWAASQAPSAPLNLLETK